MNSTAFVLFLVFLILKLCSVIAWSWWWVTAPLWIGLAFSLVIFFIAAAFITKAKKTFDEDLIDLARRTRRR